MARILQTVKDVLASTSARRIDFHLGMIGVDTVGLMSIYHLVSFDQIHINVLAMKQGVAAQYVPSTNTLEFPRDDYGANAKERSDILHECVHALHDMYGGGSWSPKRAGSRFTPRSENEAAAYVADALYYSYETGGGAQSGNGILDMAAVIARRIASRPGAFVTEAEARAMRVLIVLDPAYNYGYYDPTIADGA